MISIVFSAWKRELHPHLIKKKELQHVINHLNDENIYEFPIPFEHVTCDKLNIAEVGMSVKKLTFNLAFNRRLLISIKIFLLKKSRSKRLYKMHSVSISQHKIINKMRNKIHLNINDRFNSTYIQPQYEYFLLVMIATSTSSCRRFTHNNVNVNVFSTNYLYSRVTGLWR